MFHWPLEFPEVIVKRGGFDAFVGNPPFSAVRLFATSLGPCYAAALFRDYPEAKGNMDLSAFFLRQAFRMLSTNGDLGLVLTNSISEGANRIAALEPLVATGTIYRAYNSLRWPGSANVFVSFVYATRRDWIGNVTLGGTECNAISSSLTAEEELNAPERLVVLPCQSFRGSDWNGEGFLVDEHFVVEQVSREERAKEFLLRCLNARDYCDSPEQSTNRWIVFFRDRELDELKSQVPTLVDALDRRVGVERRSSKDDMLRQHWWLFRRATMPLYRAAWSNSYVFVVPFTGKYPSFSQVPSNQVFANALNVFVGLSWSGFAVLQSSIHEAWIFRYCSRMKTDLRYAPSDLFETFPFPSGILPPLSEDLRLAQMGTEYHEYRKEVMKNRGEGLTKTYNRFHDPDESSADIQKLRDLHIEMDKAVAAAYGWTDLDLDLGHGFHKTKQGVRFTISEAARREVLQRLLKLNHERYAEEEKQGLHGKKGAAKKAAPKKNAVSKPVKEESTLFDMEDDK